MKSAFPPHGSRVCDTTSDTRALGRELGQALEAGDVVILDGPLGAGKTTFTQGVAEGLQVKGRVTSPTFVIAREHRSTCGGPSLIHIDAYRLLGEGSSGDPLGELDALDLDTDLDAAVVVAEWGGGLVEQIAARYLHVSFDRDSLLDTALDTAQESEGRVITWRTAETATSAIGDEL